MDGVKRTTGFLVRPLLLGGDGVLGVFGGLLADIILLEARHGQTHPQQYVSGLEVQYRVA